MWNLKLPIRMCAVIFAFLNAANAAQLPPYASKPSLHSYYYPTPRRQFIIPQSMPILAPQQYQQQYVSYTHTRQQQQHQQQQQYSQQPARQQYQQQQYHTQASQPATTTYYQHSQQLPSTAAKVAQRFTAPALENAAFTTALTSQGYIYGESGNSDDNNSNAASSISAARSSSSPLALPTSFLESLAAGNDVAPEGAIDSSDASVNLQLPLPVNIAPIKVQPLPLQAGASFNELANGVTSYGTVYPQRKRR